jgi:hypothetical protein
MFWEVVKRVFFLSGFWGGGACAEPEAVVSGFEDMTVVGEAIEQGRRHFGSPKTSPHSPKLRLVVMTTLVRS